MNRYALILIAALILSACRGQNAIPTTPAVVQPEQSQVATTGLTEPVVLTPTTAVADTPTVPSAASPVEVAENTLPIECTSPAAASPAMTEGPYYTPDTPERTSLIEPGMPGTKLILTGFVLDTNCQPIANAWLDFWQADANGVYDNAGYTLRGHQFTDENGRYLLETIVPGQYPGRTEHIHVKVQAPGSRVVTTQLFFPGSNSNESDRIFASELLVKIIRDAGDVVEAEFNFVVEMP